MPEESVELVRRAREVFNEGGPEAVINAGIWSPEVVAVSRHWDLGASNEVVTVVECGIVFTLRNGEVVRAEVACVPEKAFEAAGLRE